MNGITNALRGVVLLIEKVSMATGHVASSDVSRELVDE